MSRTCPVHCSSTLPDEDVASLSVHVRAALRISLPMALKVAVFTILLRWRPYEFTRLSFVALSRLCGPRPDAPIRVALLLALWRRAAGSYRLRAYSGEVRSLRAEIHRPRLPLRNLGWSRFCGRLEIILMAGHWSMLEEAHGAQNAAEFLAGLARSLEGDSRKRSLLGPNPLGQRVQASLPAPVSFTGEYRNLPRVI